VRQPFQLRDAVHSVKVTELGDTAAERTPIPQASRNGAHIFHCRHSYYMGQNSRMTAVSGGFFIGRSGGL